jgi:dephospho-CoA kinase
MSLVIGLTGIIGTGKSQAAKYLAEKYNFQIIDVDKVGHDLLENDQGINSAVKNEFGTVNRKKIAEIVFKNAEKLQKLNSLLHPAMFKKIKELIIIFKGENKNIVIDAALLYQIGLDIFCDKVVVMKSSIDNIFGRLIEKGLNKKQINERLASAPIINESDDIAIINNDGPPKDIYERLDRIIEGYSN